MVSVMARQSRVLRWRLKESRDGETLIAVGIWFQICGAAEEKARRPKSVFILETFLRRRCLKQIGTYYRSGTGGLCCTGAGRGFVLILARRRHFSAWNHVMASILKLWRQIQNPTTSVDAYLREEHFCQISSRSQELKTFLFCDAFNNVVVWTSVNIHLNQLAFTYKPRNAPMVLCSVMRAL